MAKEKKEFENIKEDENEFEDIEEDKEEFEDIEESEDKLEGIEEDKKEFEDIEEDETDKESAKELRKISASDPSGPMKITITQKPIEITKPLEQIAGMPIGQSLEEQLLDEQFKKNDERDDKREENYSETQKDRNNLYEESEENTSYEMKRNESKEYSSNTKIGRFNKDKASAFDSDGLRDANYMGNQSDGTMQKGVGNEYEMTRSEMRINRPNQDGTFKKDPLRVYEL